MSLFSRAGGRFSGAMAGHLLCYKQVDCDGPLLPDLGPPLGKVAMASLVSEDPAMALICTGNAGPSR